MKSKHIFYYLLLLSQNLLAQAEQGKYLVIFKDKIGSTYSIEKPLEYISQKAIDRRKKQAINLTINDLPPNKTYIDELKKAGATIWYKSRWYNAALVLADSSTALKIKALPFVKGFENNGPMNLKGTGQLRKKAKFETDIDTVNFGNGDSQARMLGTQNLHNAGYKGNGMVIGVLDDGFSKVDKNTYLAHLYTGKKVLGTYDFVRNSSAVYDVGGHGSLVLSTMASNIDGKFVGTAPEASYVLLRSEEDPGERIIEEANWLFAAEFADSVGVDVINTSLGYFDYDYAPYTHSKQDLDGDKTLITKAADWAAAAGILVCVSAGNAGNAGIGSPADADSVLTIGSVDRNEIKSGFSSIGPTADGRIKPDLSAMGSSATWAFVGSNNLSILSASNGTSFSCPIFAGFATCFWQANPSLKMMEVQAALKKLGTQANTPDNKLGYGIPKFGKIIILANEQLPNFQLTISPNPTKNILKASLPDHFENSNYEISIFNETGNSVYYKNSFGKFELDVTNLNMGLYFGKISNSKAVYHFKFLKE